MSKFESFLSSVGDFYTPSPEEAVEKKGIGHEVEHIKGVMIRSCDIAEITSNCYKATDTDGSSIDLKASTLTAALHDIGNTIERGSHHHMGRGILQGELSIQDVLSVPEYIKNNEQSKWGLEVKVSEYIDAHPYDAFESSNLSQLTPTERDVLRDAAVESVKFDVAYHGISVSDAKDHIASRFGPDADKGWIETVYEKVVDTNADTPQYKSSEITACVNSDMPEKLQKLTDDFKEVCSSDPALRDKMETIAIAVQDHNVDFYRDPVSGEKERYEARNIYGAIVADADKDNVAKTFIERTYAFAVNKWPDMKTGAYMIDRESPDNQADKMKAISHVLHQTYERFRPFELSVPSAIFAYKPIEKIKGIEPCTADTPNAIRVPDTYTDYKGREYDNISAGKFYRILESAGDDRYSQIDARFGNGLSYVADQRTQAMDTLCNYLSLNDDQEKVLLQVIDSKLNGTPLDTDTSRLTPEQLEGIEKLAEPFSAIIQEFDKAETTIEGIVAAGEKEYYNELLGEEYKYKDMEFQDVVDAICTTCDEIYDQDDIDAVDRTEDDDDDIGFDRIDNECE